MAPNNGEISITKPPLLTQLKELNALANLGSTTITMQNAN